MLQKYLVLHILCLLFISIQSVSHQKQKYACIFCQKLFNAQWEQNRHQFNYCKINPDHAKAFYRCSTCNKEILKLTQSRHEQSLYHQKKLSCLYLPAIQTHEELYVCQYTCGKTFPHKKNRKHHELYCCRNNPNRIDKYYQCTYCNILVKNKSRHLSTQKHRKNIEKNYSTTQDIFKLISIPTSQQDKLLNKNINQEPESIAKTKFITSPASSVPSDPPLPMNNISFLPTGTPLIDMLTLSNEEQPIDNIPMPDDITTMHI